MYVPDSNCWETLKPEQQNFVNFIRTAFENFYYENAPKNTMNLKYKRHFWFLMAYASQDVCKYWVTLNTNGTHKITWHLKGQPPPDERLLHFSIAVLNPAWYNLADPEMSDFDKIDAHLRREWRDFFDGIPREMLRTNGYFWGNGQQF